MAAQPDLPIINLQPEFYEENNFVHALASTGSVQERADLSAVIVPHHLLASEYVAEMLKMTSGREIRTVVVIGPNHLDIGPTPIATTRARWRIVGRVVPTDDDIVARFMFDLGLKDNPVVFGKEHSIGVIVPFVGHYFPRAKILPIVLSSTAGIAEMELLGDWLGKNLDEYSLVVFSIDFSHYLAEETADQKDTITRQLIGEKNIAAISHLNNDYVDSPASLGTALVYARNKDLVTNIIVNSNSNDFSPTKSASTTSYFVITFTPYSSLGD